MQREKKISLTKRYEYWLIADELGYSLQCKDRIMHAHGEHEIERIMIDERKKES